jgi:hypothetical protein
MIHALLLTLALPIQGAPVHAALHPVEADLYLEVGDASALLTSLDGAPMLRFLRDERLKGLFEELGSDTTRPLKELVKEGLGASMPDALTGNWIDGLKTVSVSGRAIGGATDTTSALAVLAIADFAAPEQAQALKAFVLTRGTAHEPISGSLPGLERLKRTDKPSEDLWCVDIGARLVVGNSAAKLEDYVARADKKAKGLATSETFQKQLAALEPASGTPVLWFALARPLVDIVTAGQGADMPDKGVEFLRELPSDLNPFASARVARMQLVGQRFVTEMYSGPVAGEAAAKPVDLAWLEPVPSGQMLVYASAFDGAAVGKRMRELLAKDEASAASLAAIEQKLGYGPERLLARLGPGMTVYSAPLAGLALPETRIWIDCDDSAAFAKEFEALVTALGETLPGYQAKTKPYKVKRAGTEERIEIPITTLTLPPDMQMPMISLSPSFAPVGKKLVFGFGSGDVKNELKRVHAGDGEPIVAGAKPLAAMGFEPPAGATSVFVMDWGKLLGGVIGTVKAFAGLAGPEAMPFDLKKLPPQEMFTEHFKPTFHFAKAAAGGTYRRNEASFGPETWLGLLGAGAMASRQMQNAGMGGQIPVEPLPLGEEPAPVRATPGGG